MRLCYYLNPTFVNDDGNFVPAIVQENEAGYHLTNYDYGKDYALAEKCVEGLNTKLGLTKQDAQDIVTSSMRASNQVKRARHTSLRNLPAMMSTKSPDVKEVIKKRFAKAQGV
jgi:hypothetical protein